MTDVDQPVDFDEVISTRFVPVNTDQEYAILELYTTNLTNEKYMVPSMSLAAKLKVPLPIEPVRPVRVQFVQDVSCSMDGEKIQASKGGLKEICRKLTQADEVGLIKFGSRVEVVSAIQPYSHALGNEINGLETLGMTALYNGIVEGVRGLKERAEASNQPAYKNILLITTDGEENSSNNININDVIALIQNPGIPNFRMVLAIAGSMNSNDELVNMCQSNECQGYCDVINVADSRDGIKQAYAEMDQKVKLFRVDQEHQSEVIKLNLRFGATEMWADAVVEGTEVKVDVKIEFEGRRS